ncbi:MULTISPECIES: DUF6514 family protein [unclassified Ruminococcus]|uniref:DUF6514 family protein n=1 Tax=unclassified Ruminococcus TaxID=2608920 RepID=UPI00210F1B87|nr:MULTISPECIES: DUF6514 family protein [unclassified Ruminococcus]MCQ4022710.1 hypothetical protein [Ruminococcus sp. zg-924]MCQ4114950.1 hypothetical protein [Ruminococcus sp. zg-921]
MATSSRISEKDCYSLVYSDSTETKYSDTTDFGISFYDDSGQPVVVDGVSESLEFALQIIAFLNENEVAPEHFYQVLEEILCGWIHINES